eukprot:1119566-Prymnesium_polylepis.1
MDSKLHNKRVSGFVHMTSEVHAKLFIDQFCNINIGSTFLYAKIEKCEVVGPEPVAPRPPRQPRAVPKKDDDGFETARGARTVNQNNDTRATAARSGFALLDD